MNFDATIVSAVTGHMNGDHRDDNVLIAKAFGYPETTAAKMIGLDGRAGLWSVTDPAGDHELRVEWPGGEIAERPQIRREVVKLYRAACERLGVPARDEHEQAAASPHAEAEHGGHPHGAPHGRGADHEAGADEHDGPAPFSRVIRESSWGDHSGSESASFMEDIMRGNGTLQDYVDLSVQHYFMYEALEEVAQRLVSDPAYADFHPAALVRLGALEADLAHLIGADWRERARPVPATQAYAARIREIGAEGWLPGIVAHHYTRYLGDLSGGQMIARRVSKQHGLDGAGVAFYDFDGLGDIAEFKNAYRARLDRLGETLDETEQRRMLDEVRRAYGFNTAVFADLGKQKAAAIA